MSGDVFIEAQLQRVAAGGAVGAPVCLSHMNGSVSRSAKSFGQQIGGGLNTFLLPIWRAEGGVLSAGVSVVVQRPPSDVVSCGCGPRQQRSPCGGANTARGVGVVQTHAFVRQSLDVWRVQLRLGGILRRPIANAGVSPTEVVHHDEQNVRLVGAEQAAQQSQHHLPSSRTMPAIRNLSCDSSGKSVSMTANAESAPK